MGYKRAEEILPAEIIELIQQYADGVNIYIPRKNENRAKWGQVSKAKEKRSARDEKIYKEYGSGLKVRELAAKYFLSEKSIQRILRQMKSEY